MFGSKETPAPVEEAIQEREERLAQSGKGFWERLWPVLACGAGLFSDGYVNNVSSCSLGVM